MKKSLAIFVHGFNSGPECWNQLVGLMQNDPAITAAFDLIRFSYQSKIRSALLNPIRRIPDYREIAKEFNGFVEENFTSSYSELYLIGHSQGGLILQDWLVQQLNSGKGRQLRNVRELLMIATPTLGSNIGFEARRILFAFLRNPQEQHLRAFDLQVAETRRAVEQQIVEATESSDRTCPIPVVAFWGTEDNVVRSPSAEASFEISVALPGDHFTIIRPKDRDDVRYRQVAQSLLVPHGHKHVYEIDLYETSVRVEPLAGKKQAFVARRKGTTLTEYADNFARLQRRVCFSPKNHCLDLFRYNYQTNERGYLISTVDMQPREPGEPVPRNEAATDEVSDFAQSGTQTTYKFTPQPGHCHSQNLEIWNGFNPGGRDVHFHTGNNLRCKIYSFVVDLSAYSSAGWNISEPQLFIYPWDTGEHQRDEQRVPENRLPVSEATSAGTWTWTVPNFRGGIVDAVWDVREPAAQATSASPITS